MNYEQAMNIMEQAVLLALKGVQTTQDAKAILIAWDTVKPLIKPEKVERDG